MSEDFRRDGAETLHELIEADKRQAYRKFHGDDFPKRFAGLHGGKTDRRLWPIPLLRGLIAAVPVMLAILAAMWLLFRGGTGSVRPPGGRRGAATSPLEPDPIASTIGKTLEMFVGAEKLGESRMEAPAEDRLDKAEVRSRLFSEIIAKFKEV